MLAWSRDSVPKFSIRREVMRHGGISHTQVSRLSSGKRRLTRDLVEPLARLLQLNADERVFLDRWVKHDRAGAKPSDKKISGKKVVPVIARKRTVQNHLLHDWLNVYVRDAVKLKKFKPDVQWIYHLLGGIASPERIKKSLAFLQREGFLRRTIDGRLVQNDVLVASSDGLPNAKIRAFHKQALHIARRNIDLLPVGRRLESALIMHLNPDSALEVRELLREFYERLVQFAEERPDENQGLYQILLNYTPISAVVVEGDL